LAAGLKIAFYVIAMFPLLPSHAFVVYFMGWPFVLDKSNLFTIGH